jgi:hypothetical protein
MCLRFRESKYTVHADSQSALGRLITKRVGNSSGNASLPGPIQYKIAG